MNQGQSSKEDWCGRLWNGMELLKDVTENKHVLPTGLEGYSHALSIQSSSHIGYVDVLIYITYCDQYDPSIIYLIFQLPALTHFLEAACAKVS